MSGYLGALTESFEHAAHRVPRIPDWCAFYSIAGGIVHIKAPPENAPRNSVKHSIAFCGGQAWDTAKGSRAIADPQKLPPGMRWCGKCLGAACAFAGKSEQVAALLTEELWS